MAVIKILPSKGRIKKIINYVLNKEKTDDRIISGKDCSPQNAADEMNITKELHNKIDGISYHHIIQSFKPDETNAEKAHEIGKELAKSQFKGHEVLVVTHIDKDHIHNHLIVNSVSFKNGSKLVSNKETLREIKRESNRICQRENLSIIKGPNAHNRYSIAEYKLAEKGMPIWKEQLRSAIDEAKEHSKNLVELRQYLKKNFNIDMKIQNKNLSFLHPEKQKYCRGKMLGHAYTKEEITDVFQRGPEHKKVNPGLPYRKTNFKIPEIKNVNIGLSRIAPGIESIASKISRDIEKEKIRVEKKKEKLSRSMERYAAGDRRRER
ncbi:MAG: relaxase/mobilization nuclease domain-containing protein [Actinobacteria bacterium]|nr:relaxase/mobilization nuclease domain-containing protein [Actinomycetota bacterium]